MPGIYKKGNEAIFRDNGEMISQQDVVDLLNSLSDENKQLRKEIERLQKIIDLTSYQLKVQDRILKEVGE